jgi:hypothetical protein
MAILSLRDPLHLLVQFFFLSITGLSIKENWKLVLKTRPERIQRGLEAGIFVFSLLLSRQVT